MSIVFVKPKDVKIEDITEKFIERLAEHNIKSVKVPPVYVIEQIAGAESHEIRSNSTKDMQFIFDQIIELNPQLVLVREVTKRIVENEIDYIVRIDYIKVM